MVNTSPLNTTPFNYAVPASETEIGKIRIKEYYEALGMFMDDFSRVEISIQLSLWHYAKLSHSIARAILSGSHLDNTMSFMRRLADVGAISQEKWEKLEPLLDRLGLISKSRNRILHYGAQSVAEGRGMVTNAVKALTEDHITHFPISPIILGDMSFDLKKVMLHLLVDHMGRPSLRARHASLEAIALAPWRYKPQPSPQAKPKRDRPKGKVRADQPESSPASQSENGET
jgi:hypothetical protein